MKSKSEVYREMAKADLIESLERDQMQLNRMKLNHSVSPLDNPMALVEIKKNIARMKTELIRRESEKTSTAKPEEDN